jgi:uncharacterized membrane protein
MREQQVGELFRKVIRWVHFFFHSTTKVGRASSLVKTYTGEDTNVATYAYLPFISAVILVFRKDNSEFVSFHARQALVLLLITLLALLFLGGFLRVIVLVVFFILFVFGAYKASRGEKWYFPLVSELANTIEI